MILRILRGGLVLAVCFLLATLVAQAGMFAYLGIRYGINQTKMVQMMAILQDVDLFAMKEETDAEKEEVSVEQVSYAQILETRAEKTSHLELREQAIRNLMDLVRLDQRKLAEEQQRYKQIRTAFDQELAELQERAVSEGMDDVRSKLETLKAPQTKDLLMAMLDPSSDMYAVDDVVTLLKGMPNSKAAKIIGQFKMKEELDKIGDVLRRIREGTPVEDLAAKTRTNLVAPAPGAPRLPTN